MDCSLAPTVLDPTRLHLHLPRLRRLAAVNVLRVNPIGIGFGGTRKVERAQIRRLQLEGDGAVLFL